MINLFIGLGLLLILVALAFLLGPLLRRQQSDASTSSLSSNARLFESRMQDLKADKARGALSESDYAAMVHELERDLLAQVSQEAAASHPTPSQSLATMLAIVALIPTATIFLYLYLGNPKAMLQDQSAHPLSLEEKKNLPSMPELIVKLEKRLQETPDDPQGWVFLGRTYAAADRMADSVKAYQKAHELAGDDPNLLADLAESMAITQNYSMAGDPTRYVEQVLKMVPDHSKGLWLGGTAAFQTQNYPLALARWIKLLGQMPAQSEDTESLRQYIQDAISQLPAGAQQAYRDQVPAPLAPIVTTSGNSNIRVNISLSPSMQNKVSPQDIVFVFARAVNGPKAPLAITKLTVKDLPAQVTLDESMAMMPELSIAKFDQVIVGARVSKSGQPIAASGDIEGLSDLIENREQEVNIEISKLVP